ADEAEGGEQHPQLWRRRSIEQRVDWRWHRAAVRQYQAPRPAHNFRRPAIGQQKSGRRNLRPDRLLDPREYETADQLPRWPGEAGRKKQMTPRTRSEAKR